jgi:hypothetical protein
LAEYACCSRPAPATRHGPAAPPSLLTPRQHSFKSLLTSPPSSFPGDPQRSAPSPTRTPRARACVRDMIPEPAHLSRHPEADRGRAHGWSNECSRGTRPPRAKGTEQAPLPQGEGKTHPGACSAKDRLPPSTPCCETSRSTSKSAKICERGLAEQAALPPLAMEAEAASATPAAAERRTQSGKGLRVAEPAAAWNQGWEGPTQGSRCGGASNPRASGQQSPVGIRT